MIYEYDKKEILPKLKEPLRSLLDSELTLGNEIVEVSSGWPIANVNVWLKNPIAAKNQGLYPSVEYSYRADPKYWLEDYVDKENEAMIAVKT